MIYTICNEYIPWMQKIWSTDHPYICLGRDDLGYTKGVKHCNVILGILQWKVLFSKAGEPLI